ncbi:50S ribosomal protein L9 [Aquirufa sp.]|jgi:large subunit ribosomal protein L9|uniref:50S ribosomal protein L9 n=1 Tax=Aquirufa sp. TaxID=2676249 RepID=UPI0037BF303B
MEIILKTDIAGLGYKNDVVAVKAGYGRNYLIPQGFAVMATPSNRKVLAENVKQAAHKVEKIRQDAFELASSIGELSLTIAAKAGDSGKIFGRVTSLQISEMLKEKGFDVDRKKISFDSEVKMTGDYTATLDLHKEVKHKISFSVVGE